MKPERIEPPHLLGHTTVKSRSTDMRFDSFEALVEHAPDGILVDVDQRVVLVNRALRDLLGSNDPVRWLGTDVAAMLCPQDAGRLGLIGTTDQPRVPSGSSQEIRLRRLDGVLIEVEVRTNFMLLKGQTLRQWVVRAVGERKRLERRQGLQQSVLAMIAAHQTLDDVLREMALAIEQQTPSSHCSVFVAAEDGQSFVALHSSRSGRLALMETDDLRLISADSPSVSGRAASLRQPVFVEDVQKDSASPQVRAVRRALGAKAAFAWPVLSRAGDLMGVIYLTLAHTGAPDPELCKLIADYSDITAVAIDNERQAARIRHLGQYDVLTGLPNRAMFKELLQQAIDRARRQGSLLAAMFVDLDHFKLINDTFGHETGDAVLRKAAERLKHHLRDSDRVARVSGDEFIVLVDDLAGPDAAADVAQRIRDTLAQHVTLGEHEHQMSASIGIALYPRDGEDSERLIKHADIAMSRAKQTGRNCYSFFAEADNAHSTERFALQAQIRRALQRREFLLHYQPRVDLCTGKVRGVEALVRWQHPQRGLVMPGDFIVAAEESGLILGLGQQVMEMAFDDVPRLRAHGADTTVAINLSALQIGSGSLVDEVSELLARTGVSSSSIEFEITESLLMHDPERARGVIETLRGMGFAFSLDDFGTGYSSLTYLKRFPVQCVKIDRSFVKDIPGDASDLAITRAIVAMAHSLSLHVVAEGVETPEQLHALQQMGCDQYQGYLFSKPVSVDQVLLLIEASRRA